MTDGQYFGYGLLILFAFLVAFVLAVEWAAARWRHLPTLMHVEPARPTIRIVHLYDQERTPYD